MAKQNVTDSARAGADFPFTSQQYRWLGVGLGLLVVGYLLMSGGASDDP